MTKDIKNDPKMRDRSKSTDSTNDPFSVSSLIGQGIFQKMLIIFLCVFIAPFMAFNNIPQYLILLEPEFECKPNPLAPIPNVASDARYNSSKLYNIDQLQLDYPDYSVETKYPATNPLSLHLELLRECEMKNRPGVPCQYGYKYKFDFIYPTIVSMNDWVCANSGPKFLAHSLYWLGSIFGVLVIGQVSDLWGRIPAIILCHLIAGAAGTLTPFSEQRIPLFFFLRFCLGFVIQSQGSIAYVLVMELVKSNQRSFVSNLYLLTYSVMAAALPWFAYALMDWEMLSVLTSVPFLVIPFVVYFIPESIKWQITMNRIEEAKLTIKKIAGINNTPISDETLKYLNLKKDLIDTSESLIDIFKYRRFLTMFALTNLLWFCQNVTYTGAIAFAAISTDNPYMMLTINSLIDILAAIGSNYAGEILGRKRATIYPGIIAGILYPISAFMDQDAQVILFLFTIMGGRLFLTIAFDVQYMYAAEVYPTSIRARAYAVRMSIGSLGGLIAPQVVALGEFVHDAVPLTIFGISSILASIIMIFLPETQGLELPKSLIDGEVIGLVGEERFRVISKYQKSAPGNGNLNFKEWAEKEGVAPPLPPNNSDIDLHKKSIRSGSNATTISMSSDSESKV